MLYLFTLFHILTLYLLLVLLKYLYLFCILYYVETNDTLTILSLKQQGRTLEDMERKK